MPNYRKLGLPKLTGNPGEDIQNLRNAFYQQDEQLRYLFEHLDGGNFTDEFFSSINDGVARWNTDNRVELDTAGLVSEVLSAANDAFTRFEQTVQGITLTVVDSEGNETSVNLSSGKFDISFLEDQIDDAEKVATNFISMRADGGIEVGNKSGGNWTGYRTQMLADRFCIVDDSNNELASYEANAIYLGKSENKDTVIDFNNGMVTLSYDADNNRALMDLNSIYIFSESGYDVSIGSTEYDGDSNAIGGQVVCNANGARMSGHSGDRYSVDLYTELYLMFDGRGLWESVGTDSDGYLQSSSIEMWPNKLKIRGNSINSYGYQGRKNALIATDNKPGNTTALYPIASMKTTSGDWSIGTIGEALNFVYTKDTDYNASANNYVKSGFNADGSLFLNGKNFVEYGTWTPMLQNLSGDNPSVSYNWNAGYYYRIGNMVFISADISPNISDAGGSVAFIAGLPYTAISMYYGLSMCEAYNVFNHGQSGWNIIARIEVGSTIIRFQSPTGSSALSWIANVGVSAYNPILRFSGWYRIA